MFVSFFLGRRTIFRSSSRASWPEGGTQVDSGCSTFNDSEGSFASQGYLSYAVPKSAVHFGSRDP